VQTWAIGNGYGISPPDTVTPLSGAIIYYVVQLAFLITTVAIAASLAVVRGGPGGRPSRRPLVPRGRRGGRLRNRRPRAPRGDQAAANQSAATR